FFVIILRPLSSSLFPYTTLFRSPIVYLLLRSVKLNHEYIADEKATQSNDDRINYANLLVSHAFSTPVHSIMNNFFNKPFLKNRIMMLFKNKSRSEERRVGKESRLQWIS